MHLASCIDSPSKKGIYRRGICSPHCGVNPPRTGLADSLLISGELAGSLCETPTVGSRTAGKRNEAENVLRSSTRLALKSLLFLTFEVRQEKNKGRKEKNKKPRGTQSADTTGKNPARGLVTSANTAGNVSP